MKQRRELAERAAMARMIRVASKGAEKEFNRMVKKLEDEGQ